MPADAPKFVSRPTGTTATLKFRVWSLDVWGHSLANCDDPAEHDDACGGFEVNDRASQGYVEIVADGTEHNAGTPHAFTSHHATDAQIVAALRDAGYLDDTVTVEMVEIDGDPEYSLDIDQALDGRPVLQLEREKD